MKWHEWVPTGLFFFLPWEFTVWIKARKLLPAQTSSHRLIRNRPRQPNQFASLWVNWRMLWEKMWRDFNREKCLIARRGRSDGAAGEWWGCSSSCAL